VAVNASVPPPCARATRRPIDWPCAGVVVLALLAAAISLLLVATRVGHSLEEVHSFYYYVQPPWRELLTSFREPGHHVLHDLVLKLVYPLAAGSRLALRWPSLVWSVIFLGVFAGLARLTTRPTEDEDRMVRILRLAIRLLLPLACSYFVFFATQSRGYALGLLLFALFVDASARVTEGHASGFRWGRATIAAAAGAACVASVLSNAAFVAGAAVGFLVHDAAARRSGLLVRRAAVLLGAAVVLALLHPANRHPEQATTFVRIFGTPFSSLGQAAGFFAQLARQYLGPAPLLLGALSLVGLYTLARRNRAMLLVMVGALGAPLVWALATRNGLFARSYYALFVVVLLLIDAGVDLLLGLSTRPGARRRLPGRLAACTLLAGVVMLGVVACREAITECGNWGVGIDTKVLVRMERPWDLTVMPWSAFQSYHWELGPSGDDRFDRLIRARRVDRLRIVAHRQTHGVHVESPRGVEHRVRLLIDGTHTFERQWSRSLESHLLAPGRPVGVWRGRAWHERVGGLPGPDAVTLLLYRAPPSAANEFDRLRASDDFLFYDRGATVSGRRPHARLVLEPDQVEEAARIATAAGADEVAVFAFPLPASERQSRLDRP
jgi:hypothetical protein